MKKIISIFLVGLLLTWNTGFTRDNIYGDYLLGGYDKNISLDLEGAQLLDVLKMLSQQSGFNFVSTEAVRERALTLYLEEVPLRQALDIIFAANHLAYDYYPDSNMFVIKEMGKPDLELMSKVYRLRYARVQDSRMQKDIKALLEIEEQSTASSAGAAGGTGSDEKDKTGIAAAVETVLTEFGKITADPITNSLTVIDVPSRFPLIDNVINQLDISQPVVMIEVEMLDVAKNTVDQMGVNWPATLANLAVTGTRTTSWPFGDKGNNMKNSTWSAEMGTLSNLWEFTAIPAGRFSPSVLTVVGADLALQFLKTQTDTKFLARPKILTISNETAEIKITTDELIGGTVTSSGGTNEQSFSTERAQTGTALRVTPQVDHLTGEVTLFVEMIVKAAVNSSFVFGASSFISGTLKDPEERKASAVVRLKEGQTLFMGGLIKNEVNEVNSKVPILGDIPIIGRAFRHKNKQAEERELMVFITPRVLKDGTFMAKNDSKVVHSQVVQREQLGSPRRSNIKLALDAFSR